MFNAYPPAPTHDAHLSPLGDGEAHAELTVKERSQRVRKMRLSQIKKQCPE